MGKRTYKETRRGIYLCRKEFSQCPTRWGSRTYSIYTKRFYVYMETGIQIITYEDEMCCDSRRFSTLGSNDIESFDRLRVCVSRIRRSCTD